MDEAASRADSVADINVSDEVLDEIYGGVATFSCSCTTASAACASVGCL